MQGSSLQRCASEINFPIAVMDKLDVQINSGARVRLYPKSLSEICNSGLLTNSNIQFILLKEISQ